MANHATVGHFTDQNIVAVLQALPQTDSTYAEVVRQAREYDVAASQSTLAKWVANGRTDGRAALRLTATVGFAQSFGQPEYQAGGGHHSKCMIIRPSRKLVRREETEVWTW